MRQSGPAMGAVSFLLFPALLLLVADGHALVENETCKQGTIFRRDCNLCLCGANGSRQLSTCTTWSCNKPAGAMINRIKRAAGHSERCFPGDRYKKDCNDCICSQDGIKDHASCTFALCPNKPR